MIELTITLVLLAKGFSMLLKFLAPRLFKGWVTRETKKRKKLYAEDVIYDTNKTYILYSIVQNNFHYCMQNGLLKRNNILEFKFMLNKFADHNEFKHEKFENDAHEIYRKLKSHSISSENMLQLNEFLQPFIAIEVPRLQEEPIRKYGNLVVVK